VLGLLLSVGALASCTGSQIPGPAGPSQTTITVGGRVTTLQTGEPVSNAFIRVRPGGETHSNASGMFSRVAAPGELAVLLSAPEHLIRGLSLIAHESLTDLAVNMISAAPPFSETYYRDFVRGERDFGRLEPLRRWTQAPRLFYLNRTTDTDDDVPDVVIDAMEELAIQKMPLFTGGQFVPAEMARGPAPPAIQVGWIVVESFSNGIPGSPGAGGTAAVGANPGRIRLQFDPQPFSGGTCRFHMAGAFSHELVHALGFYHVSGGWTEANQCLPVLPEAIYHARIAYLRPVGNTHPDLDPPFAASLAPIAVR
jgi:hypothetical protein